LKSLIQKWIADRKLLCIFLTEGMPIRRRNRKSAEAVALESPILAIKDMDSKIVSKRPIKKADNPYSKWYFFDHPPLGEGTRFNRVVPLDIAANAQSRRMLIDLKIKKPFSIIPLFHPVGKCIFHAC
ncbi:MAG: hypothetical protein QME27_08060, partial [Syntrophaceae bacterium]|nr:hypothetical protein [Syntrophaceae bacterium]